MTCVFQNCFRVWSLPPAYSTIQKELCPWLQSSRLIHFIPVVGSEKARRTVYFRILSEIPWLGLTLLWHLQHSKWYQKEHIASRATVCTWKTAGRFSDVGCRTQDTKYLPCWREGNVWFTLLTDGVNCKELFLLICSQYSIFLQLRTTLYWCFYETHHVWHESVVVAVWVYIPGEEICSGIFCQTEPEIQKLPSPSLIVLSTGMTTVYVYNLYKQLALLAQKSGALTCYQCPSMVSFSVRLFTFLPFDWEKCSNGS